MFPFDRLATHGGGERWKDPLGKAVPETLIRGALNQPFLLVRGDQDNVTRPAIYAERSLCPVKFQFRGKVFAQKGGMGKRKASYTMPSMSQMVLRNLHCRTQKNLCSGPATNDATARPHVN